MNQILFNKKVQFDNYKKFKNYRLLFIFSIIMFSILFIILFIKVNKNDIDEQISKKLSSSYSVATLYSENSVTYTTAIEEPFVIGIIKIDKINLNYSILSVSNNDLLDISVCRFAGPMPNEIGNLCIAGHNYVDYKFFSRLYELEIEDIITIYGLDGSSKNYSIYDIYEIKSNDVSVTSQETNNLKIVTLITCNNVNGKRLVVQAKEIP